jgi:hypothetical protein
MNQKRGKTKMDFKSYMKNRKPTETDKKTESDLKEKLKGYEGKSRGDIMSELMAAVEKGKKDGSLSSEQLEVFYQKAAPMLSEEQRKRMKEIIDSIK